MTTGIRINLGYSHYQHILSNQAILNDVTNYFFSDYNFVCKSTVCPIIELFETENFDPTMDKVSVLNFKDFNGHHFYVVKKYDSTQFQRYFNLTRCIFSLNFKAAS
jgi:hypothetical protein